MNAHKEYSVPNPIIDTKEDETIEVLLERYNKLLEPSKLSKAGEKVVGFIPDKIKNVGKNISGSLSEMELYQQAMKIVAEGFKRIEEQAAKFTISENTIIKKVNSISANNEITDIHEICLVRSYDLEKIVVSSTIQDQILALIEGGITGAAGFVGLPFNMVLSLFLYYRAVQAVAMFYGYDVKNDASELVIASEVFVGALDPKNSGNEGELGGIIGKIMLISELTTIKQTAKKTWEAMASLGGIGLLLVQMRALAHNSARKALEKVGKKGLENTIFRNIFKQVGKNLTKKVVQRSIPVISGVIGACFDTAQMNKILNYANIFYHKRFLIEKEMRIQELIDRSKELLVEVEYSTVE